MKRIRKDLKLSVNRRTTGVRVSTGKWEPVWYTLAMQGHGLGYSLCKEEYQTYGMSADGKLVWAGVSWHSEMTETIARGIQRCWNRWRAEYLARNPGQFPLRESLEVAFLTVHPIGDHRNSQTFKVGA